MSEQRLFKAGEFLFVEATPDEVFTPEDFDQDQRLIAQSAQDFINGEAVSRWEELNELNPDLLKELLVKAGELGFISADIPEIYGGAELDKVSSSLIMEKFALGPSGFAISHMVHTGIGSLPVVLFGTPEQKNKYLPKLAEGNIIGAFALTEPEHGSDALGARATAVLSDDRRHYILNGQKQFITNAGFADLFSTYAQIDGKQFTSFIVERGYEGVSVDEEEQKMGIHGSSTRAVVFQDVKVPVGNVLGDIGKGHVVALNTLNVGRYKVAALTVGAAKMLIAEAVRHAKTRIQFGQPICEFGLVRQKIASIVTRTYVAESMIYRSARLLDLALDGIDPAEKDAGHQIGETLRSYALECSINKIFGSEMLDYVADECVQIMGGYGYIQENPVESGYRDSRIHRIWEGTNEILRTVIVDVLTRSMHAGTLSYQKPAAPEAEDSEVFADPLAVEENMVRRVRKMLEMVVVDSVSAYGYGKDLQKEQELVGMLADMSMELFAMESAVLRALKNLKREGTAKAQLHLLTSQAYVHDAFPRVTAIAFRAMGSLFRGKDLGEKVEAIRALGQYVPGNTIEGERNIAAAIVAAGRYNLTKA